MSMNIQPYIVINGRSSRDVIGLIISSLPPITKPPMRATSESIDGRDGDIVTKLGYGAYDKTIEIGLSWGYNVDDVIDFFNQEGIITFSNEPDKYYYFALYEQIDFEKLIRFKTATVVVHVQPFKYSASEAEKSFTFSNQEQSPSGSCDIRNVGNYFSKPVITVEGSGDIEISLNGNLACSLDLTNTGKIILDTDSLNATDASGNLKNRLVTGSLENLYFKIGKNTISYSGTVTKIIVNKQSRWL